MAADLLPNSFRLGKSICSNLRADTPNYAALWCQFHDEQSEHKYHCCKIRVHDTQSSVFGCIERRFEGASRICDTAEALPGPLKQRMDWGSVGK